MRTWSPFMSWFIYLQNAQVALEIKLLFFIFYFAYKNIQFSSSNHQNTLIGFLRTCQAILQKSLQMHMASPGDIIFLIELHLSYFKNLLLLYNKLAHIILMLFGTLIPNTTIYLIQFNENGHSWPDIEDDIMATGRSSLFECKWIICGSVTVSIFIWIGCMY